MAKSLPGDTRGERLRKSGVSPKAARKPTLLDDWDVVRAAQHMLEVHGDRAFAVAAERADSARGLRFVKRWHAIAAAIHEFEAGAHARATAARARYRLFFYDTAGMVGQHDFAAESDQAAIVMAGVLFEACSDMCGAIELWHGARRVNAARQPLRRPVMPLADLSRRTQEHAVEHERIMQQSRWSIARSRRLLEVLEQAKPR